MQNIFTKKIWQFAPIILLVAVLSQYILSCFTNSLNADEREHLYATYLVYLGQLPYRDFFEHHHPLMWYLVAPLLNFFDNTSYIWYVVRAVTCFFGVLTAWIIYKIARLTDTSKTSAYVSAICWLSFEITKWHGVEYRPDNLMMLCYLSGVLCLLNYLKNKKFLSLQLAMLWFLTSFLVLQKAVVLFIPLFLFGLWLIWRRQLMFKLLLTATIIPLLIVLGLGIYLWQAGALQDYYELNWLLNAKMETLENPYSTAAKRFFIMPLLGTIAAIIIIVTQQECLKKYVAFLTLSSLVVGIGVLPSLNLMILLGQYFMLFLPMVALCFGYMSEFVLKYQKTLSGLMYVAAIYLLWQTSTQIYTYTIYPSGLKTAQGVSKIILDNSDPSDTILCNIDNLEVAGIGGLRRCVTGYYWFSFYHLVPYHLRYFKARPFVNINRVLKARRPKIIPNANFMYCEIKPQDAEKPCHHIKIDKELLATHYIDSGFVLIRKY